MLALAIAFVLHEGIRGWRVYRTVVFLPYMLAIPVLGTTFVYLLSLNGALNRRSQSSASAFLAQDWLGDPSRVLDARSRRSSSTTSSASAWCCSSPGC